MVTLIFIILIWLFCIVFSVLLLRITYKLRGFNRIPPIYPDELTLIALCPWLTVFCFGMECIGLFFSRFSR